MIQLLLKLDWTVSAFFILSQLLYRCGLGMHFYTLPMLQYLPIDVLKRDLAGSIYYMHMQPPLMNFIIGIMAKLPFNYPELHNALYILLGFISVHVLHKVLCMLGVRRKLSVGVMAWLCLFPTFIIFSNWSYTPHVEFCLCCATMYFLLRLRDGLTWRSGLNLAAALCVLGLVRAQWNLSVFVCLLPLLLAMHWREKKLQFVLGYCLGLSPLVLLYLKNFVMYGFFGVSSWAGCNIAQVAVQITSPQERQAMMESGELSRLFPVYPDYNKVEAASRERAARGEAEPVYRHDSFVEWNRLASIGGCRQDGADALAVIRRYPQRYAMSIIGKMNGIARSPSFADKYQFLTDATQRTFGWDGELGRWWNLIRPISFMFYAVVPMAVLALSLLPRGYARAHRAFVVSSATLVLAMLVVSCAFNGTEQERMRWGVAPFFLAYAAMGMEVLAQCMRGRLSYFTAPIRRLDLRVSLIFIMCGLFYRYALNLTFHGYWQDHLLSSQLLRDDLWNSLFYLHMQPPLLNLVLGVMQKLPYHYDTMYEWLYIGLGFAAVHYLAHALALLGVRAWLTLATVAWLCIFPTFLTFAKCAYVAAHFEFCLCAAGFYYFVKYRNTPMDFRSAFNVFMPFCLLGLIRPQWHLGVFVLMLAIILIIRRGTPCKHYCLGFATAMSPLLLVYLKNFLVFGFFGASSWLGCNLAQVAAKIVPDLPALVQSGEVSHFFPVLCHIDKAQIVEQAWEDKGYTPPAIAHQAVSYEYNRLSMLSACRQDMQDSLVIIRHHPMNYLGWIENTLVNVMGVPTVSYTYCGWNFLGMDYGQLPSLVTALLHYGSIVLYAVIPMAVLVLSLRQGYLRDERQVIGVGIFILVVLLVISAGFNGSEQDRMRWGQEPFYLAYAAMVAEWLLRARKMFSVPAAPAA